MKTFKDYIVEQLTSMGIEDHDGNYYQACEIHDRFEDFLSDVSKEELIEWGNEFALEKDEDRYKSKPIVNTNKWMDAITGIKDFNK